MEMCKIWCDEFSLCGFRQTNQGEKFRGAFLNGLNLKKKIRVCEKTLVTKGVLTANRRKVPFLYRRPIVVA